MSDVGNEPEMMQHGDDDQRRRRRNVVVTAVALGLVAVAFYVGFILATAARG